MRRIKKNRYFNGQPVQQYRQPPYWIDIGLLKGGIKVRVVRPGKKYYATNCLTLSAREVRQLYQIRGQVEEVVRVSKEKFQREGCQARSLPAQEHHATCCLIAFGILERESHQGGMGIYKLKRRLSFKDLALPLTALQRLREAA